MRIARIILFISILTTLFISLSSGQKSSAANNPSTTSQSNPTQTTANISFDVTANGTDINSHVLGTNLPAWLGPYRTENTTFANRTIATQSQLFRIPGGSWSNYYDWRRCEESDVCPWDWGVLKPTDFINFLQATNSDAMYTINMNGTAKEAAALVAFFNGSVDDHTVIGTDQNGYNWETVSKWAKLRRDHGNADPFYIKYWEIGNEIYGGDPESGGGDCVDWGWEDVWSCDGTEYVGGIGSGSNRKNGFTEFRNEMRKVDASIMVGAVGIPFGNSPNWWTNYNNWGNEVIAAAGDHMDFYIIHQYAYNNQPDSYQEALAQPQGTWENIKDDLDASFDTYANGRRVPIAVTEYNLFANEEKDYNQWMTRGVNMLFMADTIGQMMTHGIDMANQWDLANGLADSGTDYGMIDASNYDRNPQYYVFPLWAKFGSQMLPVNSSHDAANELSVYAGRVDSNTVSVLAINKTGNTIQTSIELNGASAQLNGTADIAQVNSLSSQTASFNGNNNPNDFLSNAPATNLGTVANPMAYSFAPYSITLLQLEVDVIVSPIITTLQPPYATVDEASASKTITIIGSNFASDSTVRWNEIPLTTNFVSATQLTAVIPAANISTPRQANITVHNPTEGTTSTAKVFRVYPELTERVYLPLIVK